MQRVVRSTFTILTLAGLAACGDKVNVIQPDTTTPKQVQSVTVTPSTVTLNPQQTASLVATVQATSAVTDRTVTWSSSNTAVVTVSSAGPSTSVTITAVNPGTAAIVAKSAADANVSGAAAVTVSALPPVTVSIGTINQGANISGLTVGAPADLTNAQGQLDITLNVDSGNQPLQSVTTILKCGTDSIVQTQSINPAVAELAAEEASAPITLSINTMALNAAGTAPLLRNNDACTIRAIARTTSGTQSASGTTTLKVNNPDEILATATFDRRASDPAANVWYGGQAADASTSKLSVAVRPIMFSGRTPVAVTVTLVNIAQSQTASTGSAPFTVGFNTAQGVSGAINVTDPNERLNITVTDNQGAIISNATNPMIVTFTSVNPAGSVTPPNQTPSSGTGLFTPARFNFDTQKPAAGTFAVVNNADQGTGPIGYVAGTFRFAADSAAGYRGPDATAGNQTRNLDNGGVDVVAVDFQTRVTGAGASTYTTRTSASALDETPAVSGSGTSYQLRMITRDALGNADTSGVIATFGVDKTAPTASFNDASLAFNNMVRNTLFASAAASDYFVSILDNLSGPGTFAGAGTVYVAQTRQWNGLNASTFTASNFENIYYTNVAAGLFPAGTNVQAPGTGTQPCVIGRFNATQAASGPGAVQAFDRGGTAIGWCTPIPYQPDATGPSGTSGIPADANNNVGYYRTTIIPSDQAGNRAAALTSAILVDVNAPAVLSIDLPQTVAGNSTVGWPAAAVDTLPTNSTTVGDIVASFASLSYASSGVVLQYAKVAGPGVAFDNVLTRTATVTPTTGPFIKNLQVNAGGAVTAVTGPNVTSVSVSAEDAAGNAGGLTANFAGSTMQITGSNSSFPNFTGGFAASANPTTISNCPASGCTSGAAAANPSATTITAIATGATGVFVDPFAGGAVQVWYRPQFVGGPWMLAGTATTAGSSDNGTVRTWTYTFSFNPPDRTPNNTDLTINSTVLEVRMIGINTNGDAVATAPVTVTLTNP